MRVSHYAPQICSPPGFSISFPHLCSTPHQRKQNTVSKLANKQTNQTKTKEKTRKLFVSPSFLPFQHLFICPGGTGGLCVSYSIAFCPIGFTCKCSGTPSSLYPHQNSSGIFCGYPSLGDLQVLFHRTSPLTSSSRSYMG